MNEIRPLQISATDEEGARFNGLELHRRMSARGMDSKFLVWNKTGSDEKTIQLGGQQARNLQRTIARIEDELSVQSLLQPFAFNLPLRSEFQNANVVHYQLIHSGFFNIAALPMLTALKPSVWTLHDPWAMTGHCVHPFGCEKWQSGCGNCPDLKTPFALKKDTTAQLWKSKDFLYSASNIDVVLASKWMMKMAESSPLMKHFRLHHIPFGIDLTQFSAGEKSAARKALGIPDENIVVCIRSNSNAFKGLEYALAAFERLQVDVPITILALNQYGHFDRFFGRYHIVEPGWLKDDARYVQTLQACDIFLMPSKAESFGMMAIEAMACSKPVIVFDGTALPEVTFAPKGAVSIPASIQELTDTLQRFVVDESARKELGANARKVAEEHYDVDKHVDKLLTLYGSAIANHRGVKNAVAQTV